MCEMKYVWSEILLGHMNCGEKFCSMRFFMSNKMKCNDSKT